MIKYTLICKKSHEFEAWFKNAENFDQEQETGRLSCPHCGSKKVSKALMAPIVRTSRRQSSLPVPANFEDTAPATTGVTEDTEPTIDIAAPEPEGASEVLREALNRVRTYVEKNADYVGDEFAEEARKIHYDETDARDIYGEATAEEVEGLHEEGVNILPLPKSPDKQN